jgi:hypothetical protein
LKKEAKTFALGFQDTFLATVIERVFWFFFAKKNSFLLPPPQPTDDKPAPSFTLAQDMRL